MSLAITEDLRELADTVRRWAADRVPPSLPRSYLEAPEDALPPCWPEIAELGWLGLHLPEDVGGSGYGIEALAVVCEELGRALLPGPFVPTVLASWLVDRFGTDDARRELLPGLADGSIVAGAAIEPGGPVLSGAVADVVVVAVAGDRWAVLDAAGAAIAERRSVDGSRRLAGVDLAGVPVPAHRVLAMPDDDTVLLLATVLLAAEAVGVGSWLVDTTATYARDRVQFGRPIGQFQGVKHRVADMLASLELARAAAWDAGRGGTSQGEAWLVAATARAIVPEAVLRIAKDAVQLHGGIGFTWEHDCHRYLRRAQQIRALLGPGSTAALDVVARYRAGARRSTAVELPPEAEIHRAEVRAFLAELAVAPRTEWNERIVDAGYQMPHWPRPWGRGAGAVEQIVIEQEFRAARVRRPHLAIAGFVLPTLFEHGTADQQQRWMRPSMLGEIGWCQLFSEPGAGSDLASLRTRADRVEGGWVLNGQKVWTSLALDAHWGICLARTDPDAPKHDGITCFFVDLRNTPGIDIRPLREMTGDAWFNEVFLTDVFVPDDCVIGRVHDGWRAGRTTLANERVTMGGGASIGPGIDAALELAGDDPLTTAELGGLLAEAHALAALRTRTTLRSLAGGGPGPESSVLKLLGVLHDQRVQEVGMFLHGAAAAVQEGDAAGWIHGFLWNRSLTIAGGTSEIQRNVIAERLLGLPRDP
jgi:alkylation response protein AidB-like acyl-CoA dehydrogenase